MAAGMRPEPALTSAADDVSHPNIARKWLCRGWLVSALRLTSLYLQHWVGG